MFIGREKELTLLQQDYIGKAVMVYGKRRVGKTTLIQRTVSIRQCTMSAQKAQCKIILTALYGNWPESKCCLFL